MPASAARTSCAVIPLASVAASTGRPDAKYEVNLLGTAISATPGSSLTSRMSAAWRMSQKRHCLTAEQFGSWSAGGPPSLQTRLAVIHFQRERIERAHPPGVRAARVHDVLQALLHTHVAGMDDNNIFVTPSVRRRTACNISRWQWRQMRPIADNLDARHGHAEVFVNSLCESFVNDDDRCRRRNSHPQRNESTPRQLLHLAPSLNSEGVEILDPHHEGRSGMVNEGPQPQYR